MHQPDLRSLTLGVRHTIVTDRTGAQDRHNVTRKACSEARSDHALGHFAHRNPQVHRRPLDPAERLRLAQRSLAWSIPLARSMALRVSSRSRESVTSASSVGDLGEPADRHLDGRHQLRFVNGLTR